MKIAITVSRIFAKYPKYLSRCLHQSIRKINNNQKSVKCLSFITGDARSDLACKKILEDLGYDVSSLIPAHKVVKCVYSDSLYMARDINVVDNGVWLISIWDGVSPGTSNTTKYARSKNKKIIEFVKNPKNTTISEYDEQVSEYFKTKRKIEFEIHDQKKK